MKGRINMKKRMLAMMMAIVMVMTLLPTSALAAGGDANAPKTLVSVASESPVQITKAVSEENGAYKLTMDAYATGRVSTTDPTPSDIVLVLDVSGSMADTLSNTDQTKLDALKSAVNTFIDRTADQNAKITDTAKKNKISIVKFAGKMSNKIGNDTYDTGIWPLTNKNNYSQIVKGLTPVDQNGQNDLKAEVNKLTAAGATSADYGMDLAQTALQDSAADRNKVVVFFTDGEPNHDNGFDVEVAAAAINRAKELKTAGAKIYTIGVMEGADPNDRNRNINKYMNAVSSNYPTASATWKKHLLSSEINITWGDRAEGSSYYKATSNASELTNIFGEISTDITSGVEADDTSVLTDTISEYFVPNGITADAAGTVSDGVKVSKVAASGTDATPAWGTPEDITSKVTVTLTGKTIEVTGFDYSDKDNLVVKKNGTWQGHKLQLEFNIAADTACTTWQRGTYNYPTNVAEAKNAKNAGLAYGENGKTELTESPEVAVTAYSVTYNGNGNDGGTVTDAKAYIPGATVTVQKNTFTKKGYQFTEWQAPEGVTVTDNKFTMPAKNVTFTAQWTANDVTITFNANGGEWAENANVDDYTLIDNNTKASKTYQPSEAVAKIATDPVWNGHTFNGWYVKIPGKTGEEPEKYFITVWDATLQAQRIQEYGGVIYADWDDAAQPTEKLNYTTRQHYINEKGVEKLAVNITVQSAEKGTEISKLIQHLETDQTYYGQKYLYDDTKTTVNGVAYAKTMTLDTKGTAIDLYYYLDEWNDENDKVTGGDGTPDCQQAVVNFLADPNGSVGKDSEKPTQVFTLKKGKDGKYSEYVTPANVTPMPKENFVFDIWTKDNGETGVNPFVAQTLNGGDKVTYTAHFAADKIGSENKPDGIPDKYQAVVTYKVVGGTWKDGKTDAQVQVFTLKTKNEKTGVWEDANPVLGNTIPTGMISSYSRTASQSWDKDITKDTKVTESVTYTYTFTQGSSGGGGGSSTHYYISLKKVDAQDGEALSGAKFGLYLDGKQIATATSDRNGIVRFSMGSSNYRSLTDKSNLYCQELTAPEGYKLSNEKIAVSKKDVSTSSSTSDKNAKTVKNSRSKTPSMLNGKDHFAYIVGYPDKTVHPQSSITRAEVATIFFRLLTEETRTANATKTNNYADVSSDKWYNQAVSTLSAMGIIKGDSRGNFNPNAPITRAEFAAIAARFDKTEDVAAASFGDVAMHWAKPEISVAANNGWINGYTDGTFHPDSKITRAEAMAMINRVLQRLPESKADLLDGMIQWSDNADTSKWYYLAVQEATNSHYYELKANQHEKWTKLRENRDWTELEK